MYLAKPAANNDTTTCESQVLCEGDFRGGAPGEGRGSQKSGRVSIRFPWVHRVELPRHRKTNPDSREPKYFGSACSTRNVQDATS